MNNRGQVLVLFVILIPILILMAAFTIDITHAYYCSTKLNNLNYMVLKYGLENIKDTDVKKKMDKLFHKNDIDINSYQIKIYNDRISIKLKKEIDSVFGKSINIKTYQISSYYIGYIKNGEIVIEKG